MKTKRFMAKRFKIETTTLKNKFLFIKKVKAIMWKLSLPWKGVTCHAARPGHKHEKGKLKIAKIAEVTGYKNRWNKTGRLQ